MRKLTSKKEEEKKEEKAKMGNELSNLPPQVLANEEKPSQQNPVTGLRQCAPDNPDKSTQWQTHHTAKTGRQT